MKFEVLSLCKKSFSSRGKEEYSFSLSFPLIGGKEDHNYHEPRVQGRKRLRGLSTIYFYASLLGTQSPALGEVHSMRAKILTKRDHCYYELGQRTKASNNIVEQLC